MRRTEPQAAEARYPPDVDDLIRPIEASATTVADAARAAAARHPVTPPGEWPPATVVGHLADVDDQVWGPRLARMLEAHRGGRPRPSFAWWEPDAEATAARYADVPLGAAIDRFLTTRAAFATELRALAPDEWAAAAFHATFGEMTVASLLREELAHDAEHRASLERRA